MKKEPKILLIEDDDLIRHAIRDRLTREGFNVLEAGDGEEGLTTAMKEKPDLILLDLMLPKMSGQDFLKKLREDDGQYGKNASVIVLTNVDRARPIFETLSSGATHYLLKANTATPELVKTIKEVLDSSD